MPGVPVPMDTFRYIRAWRNIPVPSFFRIRLKQTPVFVRFSTVVGSRGSLDTVRDPRGFAVKFYTGGGIYDLVGNTLPVLLLHPGCN